MTTTKKTFVKAEKKGIYARIAIDGPTGSGKTWTALAIANGLLRDSSKRCAMIDTERSSGLRYADVYDFDHMNLESYEIEGYIEAIKQFDPVTHGVLIVDSLSHAWAGKGGALEQVDRAASRSQSQNTFFAWRDVTPLHNQLVDTLMGVPGHLIVTMRSKMEYALETNERGKVVPKRVGLAPIQREGVQYEFDIVGDMDNNNNMVISKTRASFLNGEYIQRPNADLGIKILEWCGNVEKTVTDFEIRHLMKLASVEEIRAACSTYNVTNPRELSYANYLDMCSVLESAKH